MSGLSFFKVNALPETLVANSVYFVANSDNAALADLYVTNLDGSGYRKVAGIPGANASVSNLAKVVDTYADLETIDTDAFNIAFVIDASGDETVTAGAALYVYKPAQESWAKISEVESMDMVIDWDNLRNGPESTPAQIDAAVDNSHTHENLTVLDKLGINEGGKLTVEGVEVGGDTAINWNTSEW